MVAALMPDMRFQNSSPHISSWHYGLHNTFFIFHMQSMANPSNNIQHLIIRFCLFPVSYHICMRTLIPSISSVFILKSTPAREKIRWGNTASHSQSSFIWYFSQGQPKCSDCCQNCIHSPFGKRPTLINQACPTDGRLPLSAPTLQHYRKH